MRKEKNEKRIGIILVIVLMLVIAGFSFVGVSGNMDAAKKETEITHGEATVLNELNTKRTKFTKQYIMSDGSFLANSYSMPIHFKKGGRWREVNTTLIKTKSKKSYTTKATSLKITVARKSNKKANITLKRGKSRLSIALQGKKVKSKKVKISNPKKKEKTDILNSNRVQYKRAYKNQKLTYEIYPEKIIEKITAKKKSAARKIKLTANGGKLKVRIKKNRIYFKTKKGKTKYTRLKTILTDSKGVSTSKVKVDYNKKRRTIILKPDKKWLNSKKRKFPVTVRTAYITNQHERDVKIGAAYAGSPKSNYTYNEELILRANKCVAFAQMSSLAELGRPNVKIRDARLYVKNRKILKMGAGKTFNVGIHKVTTKWSGKKVTDNNRPSYEDRKLADISLQKKGVYICDVTDVVKSWYQGVPNYGVALVAENANGSYQTKIEKNPYFSVHYEVVGFEGAVELKENQDITRDVLKSGQENYYYFNPQPGIAYELYTTSDLDTQGILYSGSKERLDYDDNSGLDENFRFVRAYDGRHYLKVNTKGKVTGKYILSLKKRFERPEPVGKSGQDSYIISWEPVKNAKEYLVDIYDMNGRIQEVVVKNTSYEYIYTNATVGKTLAFTVTPMEGKELKGETSRKIYNTDTVSEWSYYKPMNSGRIMFGSTVCDEKIYVLGGVTDNNQSVKTMEVFDTKTQTWKNLPSYPGAQSGICNMTLVNVGKDIYALGGQSDNTPTAKIYSNVYCYHTESGRWEKKASLPQNRTGMVTTVYDGKIYAFARIGTTERVDIYDVREDKWTSSVKADTSINVQAQTIDGHIYVLQEKREEDAVKADMYWAEYIPGEDVYDNEGTPCPINKADRYTYGALVGGKVYMVKENATNEVICYDSYLDKWSTVPVMNLKKEKTELQSVGTYLYSVGGTMNGFGFLDVVECFELETPQIKKQMEITKGEFYELQVEAGKCKEDTDYIVTIRINPRELTFRKTSSFMGKNEFCKGKAGIQLLKYSEKRGVMIVKLNTKMESGDTKEAYQSIPVEGLVNGKTTVEMQVEEGAQYEKK